MDALDERSNEQRGTVLVVSIASAGLVATYAVLGVLTLTVLAPRGQTANAGPSVLRSLAEHGSSVWLAAQFLFLASALFGLGLVVGLRRLAPPGRAAMADWAAVVGALGFGVLAVEQARLVSHVPGLSTAVEANPDLAREAANLSLVNLVDRYEILTYGAVGLWLLATALGSLPTTAPRWLTVTGVLAACVFLTVAVSEASWATTVASVGALTLAPVFLGGLALHLRRRPGPAVASTP
ncbi:MULTISPECIES: DUF4386 family protein [unclassified Ornithinimicrobium]|uniref:DUF4386 family protein n=1 Tax=unclassified Ornithinimicrobium TaxID=2615080 RepID=UPI0038552EEC